MIKTITIQIDESELDNSSMINQLLNEKIKQIKSQMENLRNI
jgi:hypothetical protein